MEIELELRRLTARAPATAPQRALLERSRFHAPGEPRGTRAVVLECSVSRQEDASYGEHDDDIRFLFVLDVPGAPETVSMVWHENIAPPLDELGPGDVIWVEFGAAVLRVTTWPDAWRTLVGAVNVAGQTAIPARDAWKFPLCVDGPGPKPELERSRLANREVVVRELTCDVSFGGLLSALEHGTRTLPAEVWSALALEVLEVCASHGYQSLERLRAGLWWTLTGARRLVAGDEASPAARVAVASEALVMLMPGNTLVSARLKRGAVPSTSSPEHATAFRALLAKLGALEFRSLPELEEAVRAFCAPGSRDAALGVVFSLQPRVLEAMKVLGQNPQLLPREWEGVYAPPLDGVSALAVLGDRWLEHRVPVDALPARALPPVQTFAAPPRRVSAARPDAPPDDEPKPRFKWPWQK